ncbi:MAG: anthranilate 1,2-dioxygenase [Alphaproteobacteria bacterium]|nr:anthranilate 1,2-dioxygenase [Alphaproteobacteria bacterium]
MDVATQFAVENLLARYVHALDDDRLEEWPGFFTDPCVYKIVSAENYGRGLPIGVIYADSQGMLRDRVSALREANVFEPHRYRHLVTSTLIAAGDGGLATARSNYQVVRIMQDGRASLFSTGLYIDRISFAGPAPLFAEKLVVFDNGLIDTLLAIPL